MYIILIWGGRIAPYVRDIVGPFDQREQALQWALKRGLDSERIELKMLSSPNDQKMIAEGNGVSPAR